MSLHKANSTQIAASFASISITRDPDGYDGLAHTMRVGLWIRCSDRIERPVAWALVNDANVIEMVTDLCCRSWFAMLDILEDYQDIVGQKAFDEVDTPDEFRTRLILTAYNGEKHEKCRNARYDGYKECHKVL